MYVKFSELIPVIRTIEETEAIHSIDELVEYLEENSDSKFVFESDE